MMEWFFLDPNYNILLAPFDYIADYVQDAIDYVEGKIPKMKGKVPNFVQNVKTWVYENPRDAMYLAITPIYFLPGIIIRPLATCLGFGTTIAPGSIATAWQSTIGNPTAKSLFAVLQSYGPGGYGVSYLHNYVRAVMLGVSRVAEIVKIFTRKAQRKVMTKTRETQDRT